MNQATNNHSSVPNASSIHLSERQLKYLALRAEGQTKLNAAKLAGYASNTEPTIIEKSPNLRKALISAMEVKGLTTEKLAEKIRQGVDCNKKIFSSFKGVIQDERDVPDNETQHKYVRTALEIRGDLQEKAVEVNLGLISIPGQVQTVESWNSDEK